MENWVDRICAGEPRAVARAATAIENRAPAAASLLRALRPHAGRAHIIGITGPPGAGKSTLVSELVRALRAGNHTVGVIAIDPSSPYSGGAILGDRIRMLDHHDDPGVFIRSMATRGSLGGVARATLGLALLLDAAGRDYILIETVGVGQDEVAIAGLAASTVVVLVPGMGDDVQSIKAGLMEIADLFVINKADQPGADRLEQEVRASIDLGARKPAIVRTVASEGKGIDEALAAIRSLPRRDPYAALETPGATIDHLGIAVRSIEQALEFWEARVGMKPGPREDVPEERVRVAMLPAGDSRIELLEATDSDSPIARFIEKRGEGLHHVAMKGPDLMAAIERLKASGARLLNEPRKGAGGHAYVFIHPSSAGGVLVELIQEES